MNSFDRYVSRLLLEMAVHSNDVVYFSDLLDKNKKNLIRPKERILKPVETQYQDNSEYHKELHRYNNFKNASLITSPGYVSAIVKKFCDKLPFRFKIYVNDLFETNGDMTDADYLNHLNRFGDLNLQPIPDYISIIVDTGGQDPLTPFIIGHRIAHYSIHPVEDISDVLIQFMNTHKQDMIGVQLGNDRVYQQQSLDREIDDFLDEDQFVDMPFYRKIAGKMADIALDAHEITRNLFGQYCVLGTTVLRHPKTNQRYSDLERAFNDIFYKALEDLKGCTPFRLMAD